MIEAIKREQSAVVVCALLLLLFHGGLFWYYQQAGASYRTMEGLVTYHDAQQVAMARAGTTNHLYPIQVLYRAPQSYPFDYPPYRHRPLMSLIEGLALAIGGDDVAMANAVGYSLYGMVSVALFLLGLQLWGVRAGAFAALAYLTASGSVTAAVSNDLDTLYQLTLICTVGIGLYAPRRLLPLSGFGAALMILVAPHGFIPATFLSAVAVIRLIHSGAPIADKQPNLAILWVVGPTLITGIWLLSINASWYGGVPMFYDNQGGERLAVPMLDGYLAERSMAGTSPASSFSIQHAWRNGIYPGIDRFIVNLQRALGTDPYRFLLMVCGLFWTPLLMGDGPYRRLIVTVMGLMGAHLLFASLLPDDRGGRWIEPLIALAFGAAVADGWQRIGAIGSPWCRRTVLTTMALLIGSTFIASLSAPLLVEAKEARIVYAAGERIWQEHCHEVMASLPPDAVVFAHGAMSWYTAVCHHRTVVMAPRSYNATLGVIKKLQSNHFYYLPCRKEPFSLLQQPVGPMGECGRRQPALLPYLSPKIETGYLTLYEIDAVALRRDFALVMATLP
jgi:hypothetical protein